MKKLINILKKCALVIAIGLIISNVIVPSPGEIVPEPVVSVCATAEPIEDPFDSQDYH